MSRIVKMMAILMAVCLLAPASAEAKKKKEKKVVWEMPSKMSGNENLDNFFKAMDKANTHLNSLKDSVTYYSVRPIAITQADGTVKNVRMVVDDQGNIRNADLALAQYYHWGKTAIEVYQELRGLVKQKDNLVAAAKSDWMLALSYLNYVLNGVNVATYGMSSLKDLVTNLHDQGKEIRQFKKDYAENGELKDATIDASNIDTHYSNNEPITKTPEEYEKELAAAKAEGQGIVPPDGDVSLDDIL